MQRMVPISEAKARLSELIRDAAEEDVLLIRHGRPVAVLMSIDAFEALQEEHEDALDRLSVYEADPELSVPWEQAKTELGLSPEAA